MRCSANRGQATSVAHIEGRRRLSRARRPIHHFKSKESCWRRASNDKRPPPRQCNEIRSCSRPWATYDRAQCSAEYLLTSSTRRDPTPPNSRLSHTNGTLGTPEQCYARPHRGLNNRNWQGLAQGGRPPNSATKRRATIAPSGVNALLGKRETEPCSRGPEADCRRAIHPRWTAMLAARPKNARDGSSQVKACQCR